METKKNCVYVRTIKVILSECFWQMFIITESSGLNSTVWRQIIRICSGNCREGLRIGLELITQAIGFFFYKRLLRHVILIHLRKLVLQHLRARQRRIGFKSFPNHKQLQTSRQAQIIMQGGTDLTEMMFSDFDFYFRRFIQVKIIIFHRNESCADSTKTKYFISI